MPALNNNEKYTRKICSKIANLTGLPQGVVRAVIDGLELCLLDDIRDIANNTDTSQKTTLNLELPNIGTLILHTTSYPKDMSVILDGNSFKSSFNIGKKFLNKLRWAYYGKYDYLTERAQSNFDKLFVDHYKSVIQGDDEKDE